MTNIKIIKINGEKHGKTIVILAGIHGNEKCGVKALNYIIPKIKLDYGNVIFIYANLKAIKKNKRFIEKNLNRCFLKKQPIDIAKSLEGKTAKEIIPFLEKADAMLDLHASFIKGSIPFIICDKKWVKEARIFDAQITSYNWDTFEPGSTDYYMNLQKKPGFCYECGYLKDKNSYKKAIKAIKQFLIWTGCTKKNLRIKNKQRIIKINSIYKNTNASFKKQRYFSDFTKLNKKTIIGKEGDKKVYGKKGDILLFVRNCSNINEECFLTAKETNQNINKTTKFNYSKEKQ